MYNFIFKDPPKITKNQGRRSVSLALRAQTDKQTHKHTHGTNNITSSANTGGKGSTYNDLGGGGKIEKDFFPRNGISKFFSSLEWVAKKFPQEGPSKFFSPGEGPSKIFFSRFPPPIKDLSLIRSFILNTD